MQCEDPQCHGYLSGVKEIIAAFLHILYTSRWKGVPDFFTAFLCFFQNFFDVTLATGKIFDFSDLAPKKDRPIRFLIVHAGSGRLLNEGSPT